MKRSGWRRDQQSAARRPSFTSGALLQKHWSPLTHTASPISLNLNVNVVNVQHLSGIFVMVLYSTVFQNKSVQLFRMVIFTLLLNSTIN